MVFDGAILNTDICITHKKEHGNSLRNLLIFEKIISEGKKLSPRNLFYYARELFYNGRHYEAIVYYNKFLEEDGQYLSNYLDSCIDLCKLYKLKNDRKNALRILFRSFEYDTLRAEICCMIGYYYKEERDYNKAIFWFDLAAKLKKPENSWGFIIHDFWDFIPNIELSICNYRMGNVEEAIRYNNKAAEYKPNHLVVLQNRDFLNSL